MDKGVRMQVTLAPEVAQKLEKYCKKMGVRRSAVISLALNDFLKRGGSDEK